MEQFLLSFLASCRPSFRRKATYIWFVTVLTGIMWRDDMLGMTSFIRALGLAPKRYECLANFFRSSAWDGAELLARTAAWSHRQGLAVKRNGRIILPIDDSNVPKEGVRMPLVGTIRQTSETSAKPSHFRGHTWGLVTLLAESADKRFAIPAWCCIYEPGVNAQEGGKPRTCALVSAAIDVTRTLKEKSYILGDAWFNNKTGVACVRETKGEAELISRARVDAVGYEQPRPEPVRRGRKRQYGKKIKIRQLFDDPKTPFMEGRVTLYGKPETVKLYAINLIRKPGDLIRFVLAKTRKGRIVVTSTDLEVESADALELYALRAPIEETFDAAKNVMGAKTGRFWTKALEPVSRRPARNAPRKCSSGKALDNTARAHRNNVSLSLVALAFLQVFAGMFGAEAVAMANFWTRTPSRAIPSPRIARKAIGILLRELLHGQARDHAETIFNKIGSNPDPKRADAVA